MRILLIAALVAGGLAPAAHAATDTAPAVSAPAAKAPAKKTRKVCRTEEKTGNVIPKRVCRTVEVPAEPATAEAGGAADAHATTH